MNMRPALEGLPKSFVMYDRPDPTVCTVHILKIAYGFSSHVKLILVRVRVAFLSANVGRSAIFFLINSIIANRY